MTDKSKPRTPSHRIYVVTGDGLRWTEIGAAWPDTDGRGFSLQLNAIPIGGRISMRLPKAENGGEQ